MGLVICKVNIIIEFMPRNSFDRLLTGTGSGLLYRCCTYLSWKPTRIPSTVK